MDKKNKDFMPAQARAKVVNCDLLNIRAGASIESESLGYVSTVDTLVIVPKEENGFYKLYNRDGYVMAKYIEVCTEVEE